MSNTFTLKHNQRHVASFSTLKKAQEQIPKNYLPATHAAFMGWRTPPNFLVLNHYSIENAEGLSIATFYEAAKYHDFPQVAFAHEYSFFHLEWNNTWITSSSDVLELMARIPEDCLTKTDWHLGTSEAAKKRITEGFNGEYESNPANQFTIKGNHFSTRGKLYQSVEHWYTLNPEIIPKNLKIAVNFWDLIDNQNRAYMAFDTGKGIKDIELNPDASTVWNSLDRLSAGGVIVYAKERNEAMANRMKRWFKQALETKHESDTYRHLHQQKLLVFGDVEGLANDLMDKSINYFTTEDPVLVNALREKGIPTELISEEYQTPGNISLGNHCWKALHRTLLDKLFPKLTE